MARTGVMEKLHFDAGELDHPVVCPSGSRIEETNEGPTCLCRIESLAAGEPSLITAARNPSSLAAFCMGNHTLCPTWRDARQHEWARRDIEKTLNDRGPGRTYTAQDMLELADREATGDVQGANELRRQIMERKRDAGLVAPGFTPDIG